MQTNNQPTPQPATPAPVAKRTFWGWVKYVGGITVAVSGAVLGLPAIIPIVVPAGIVTAASYLGGIAVTAVALAGKIEPTVPADTINPNSNGNISPQ